MRETTKRIRCNRCGGGIEPGTALKPIWGGGGLIPDGWVRIELASSGNPNWSRSAKALCGECAAGLAAYLDRKDLTLHSKAEIREHHGPFALEVTQLGDGWCYCWIATDRAGKQATVFRAGERRFDSKEQARRHGLHWFTGLLLRILSHNHNRRAVE